MINWLKQKFTKTVVVYRIPDYMLEPCYKVGLYTVRGWLTDDDAPLYHIDTIDGKVILGNLDTFEELIEIDRWAPISIQSTDPDAPLPSSIESLKEATHG